MPNIYWIFWPSFMVAAVAEYVHDLCEAPVLQFAQAGADIGARHIQRFCNVVGGERLAQHEEQRVNLCDGAVDAPARAHFAPVQDEAFGGW